MTDDPDDYEKYDPMRELELDFRGDGNPVHVWEALTLVDWRMPLPEWLVKYLAGAAQQLVSILDEALAQEPLPNEAERVSRALGFGLQRGKTSQFRRAALLKRDEELFGDVVRAFGPVLSDPRGLFRPREKLDRAYDIVAEGWGLDRSTVARAATRFLRRRQPIAGDGWPRTMAGFVAWRLECLNEGITLMREAQERQENEGNDEN